VRTENPPVEGKEDRTLKRMTIAGASLIVALAMAGPVTAGNGNGNDRARNLAAKQCAAEKKADREEFRATYGPEHAMRNCIKATIPEAKNAAKECKAERDEDRAAFQEEYGSNNEDGRNALGKCISEKLAEEHSA
jgi:hypothetical protein